MSEARIAQSALSLVLPLGSLRNPAHRLKPLASLASAIPPGILLVEKRVMSKLHGDKARFHRIRKRNIARRAMVKALRLRLAVPTSPATETKHKSA
jgi:hypothetical protein